MFSRFMEAVQGKELERMFREEGVIDEDDDDTGKLTSDISLPTPSSKDGMSTYCTVFVPLNIAYLIQSIYV